PNGTIFVGSSNQIYIINPDNTVKCLVRDGIFGKQNGSLALSLVPGKRIAVTNLYSKDVYVYNESTKEFQFFVSSDKRFFQEINGVRPALPIHIKGQVVDKVVKLKEGVITIEEDGTWRTWLNTNKGAWKIDTLTADFGPLFLPG